MINPIIDMHCHTTNSDGMQSPEEVYRYAQYQDIAIHAITDHDRVTRHADYPSGYHDGRLRLEGVEVSARYEHDDYRKSVHIPIYALSLRWELEDILAGIRRGKAEKVQRQCEQLKANGCMIELSDRRIVPFSYDAMRLCFPGTQEDGYNNAHLVELVLRHRDNIRKLENIASGIDAKNLMKEGFKSEWKYTKSISLRDKLPEYEPRIEELMEVVDRDNTIVSIAHPNYTFQSIDEFRRYVSRLIECWANAIEVNSTANQPWTETMLSISDDRMDSMSDPIIYTYGSDCHDLYPTKIDTRHSLLGDMNPYVSQTQRRASEIDIISRVSSPADRRAYQEYLYQHYLPTLSD